MLQHKAGLHHGVVAGAVGVGHHAQHSATVRGVGGVSCDQFARAIAGHNAVAADGHRADLDNGGSAGRPWLTLAARRPLLRHSQDLDLLDLLDQHRVLGLLGQDLDLVHDQHVSHG
ncbi:hypothetical protein BI380_32755 [Delftia tsuruhatensis]|uniref:Uncharacterized protein n=1 Tax=Delftia tsuruhatensis TaxID=180282 RepID=A0ABM6EDZ1_9BURK|nr:hypothetical protein BI380_32755 [Delftia tsuruhatensis]